MKASPLTARHRRLSRWRNALVLLAVLVVFAAVYFLVPGVRSAVDRAISVMARADIQQIKDYFLSFGPWAPIASAGLIILHAALPFLPSFPITIASGLLFGIFWGVVLVWSATMVSGAITYWMTYALGRPIVERVVSGKALDAVDRFLMRYGNRGVFIARLVPGLPFNIVGYAAGLVALPFWGYMLATAIGSLPSTILLAVVGDSLTKSPILFWITLGLAGLTAILGIIFRRFIARAFSGKRAENKRVPET